MYFTKYCMNHVMSCHLLQYTQRPRKTPVFLCRSHFFWINVFCVLGLTQLYVLYVNTISCNTKDIKSLEEGPCVKNKLHNNEGPTYST